MKYNSENCGYCGACVSVCPNYALELTEHEILIDDNCVECGTCNVVCPLGALAMEVEK